MTTKNSDEWFRISNPDRVPSPGLLIYPDRIQKNLETMVSWGDVNRLRPHVKTHKMPNIIRMKLDAGITRFKTSTIAETEMVAEAGGPDILLAYQPVGPNIDRLIELIRRYPKSQFSTLLDDPMTAERLNSHAVEAGVTIPVFIDLNVGMNRTGITPGADALELYRQVVGCGGLRAAGLHAYDGHIHDTDEAVVRDRCELAFAPVWELKSSLEQQGLEVPAVVGCGSTSSRLMARTGRMEVSAGTSVLWDAGQDHLSPEMGLLNAAVLLMRVISKPATGLICLDLGHKAVAAEMQPPRVQLLGIPDAVPVMQSEEHLVVRTPAATDLPVGEVIYGIPTHICPTVALHDQAWCVRNGKAEEPWPIIARRRILSV